ncbi:MAG: hypothetical protein JWM46_77 [Candidatus Kaiserbacteria bacterium]|nr:hypothetical protein [Candidatus Kaiserbacteria bacterium]
MKDMIIATAAAAAEVQTAHNLSLHCGGLAQFLEYFAPVEGTLPNLDEIEQAMREGQVLVLAPSRASLVKDSPEQRFEVQLLLRAAGTKTPIILAASSWHFTTAPHITKYADRVIYVVSEERGDDTGSLAEMFPMATVETLHSIWGVMPLMTRMFQAADKVAPRKKAPPKQPPKQEVANATD